jgi:SNF2 family DNA or RNA helicase
MTENDLHQYQLQAVDHIISHTHCALFLDMGLGKTVSTLTAINELMFKEVEVRRVLVIAPKRVAESVWTQEVEKWDHLKHIKVSRIIGTETTWLGYAGSTGDLAYRSTWWSSTSSAVSRTPSQSDSKLLSTFRLHSPE